MATRLVDLTVLLFPTPEHRLSPTLLMRMVMLLMSNTKDKLFTQLRPSLPMLQHPPQLMPLLRPQPQPQLMLLLQHLPQPQLMLLPQLQPILLPQPQLTSQPQLQLTDLPQHLLQFQLTGLHQLLMLAITKVISKLDYLFILYISIRPNYFRK
jgi:hypothetical protein